MPILDMRKQKALLLLAKAIGKVDKWLHIKRFKLCNKQEVALISSSLYLVFFSHTNKQILISNTYLRI